MAGYEQLKQSNIENIAKILGDTEKGFTGSEIGRLLAECNIVDSEPSLTKWKRLASALTNNQYNYKCSNHLLAFLQKTMEPNRYINNQEIFQQRRYELNKILSFEGFTINEQGKIEKTTKATTISEALARANKLKSNLEQRNVHPDVLLFCKEELLVDNYFHAVFEATKSIAEKIRKKADLTLDGSELVDTAFSFTGKNPRLALNLLTTESEKSEQKGFMNLLKGIFGTFRNTTAHAPKIYWQMQEQDALDIFSMISLVHRKLDNVIEVHKQY